MRPPIPLEDAQKRLFSLRGLLEPEELPTHDCNGRYLAQALAAQRTQPPADLSAMDGYAIRGAAPWKLVGESRGGAPFDSKLNDGQAVRISTGAIMPQGADRVLIQENAQITGDMVQLAADMPPAGIHIRKAGFDFTTGEQLLDQSAPIGPAQIALALSGGHGVLSVHRKPKLALIESGDELAADPAACSPEQIPASNNAMIAAMAAPLAERITRFGPISDDLSTLEAAFHNARNADVIVTSGGASVGDHDLIRPALESWGATIDFWRVAIKPGKPLLVARKGQQIILGLPGNPVSSFATAFLFLLPLLRHLSGSNASCPTALQAPTSSAIAKGGARREFLRAHWNGSDLTPLGQQDSSALRALSSANALIIRPENSDETKKGTNVPFYHLQNGGNA